MISSAIPARLQFQCGHAALVTLPRVKGETAAQRNERISREKSAALIRQCDFCAPAVELAVNGNHHAAADVHVVEAVAPQPERPELVLVAATESAAEVPEAEAVAELAEAEAVPVVAEPEPVAEEAQPEPAAELAEPEPVALEVVAKRPRLKLVAVKEPTPAKVEDVAPAAPAATPKRRAPQTRRTRAVEVARGRRFLVEYRVERVLHAVDIHDALRQAASLGAAQLTAITRED